MTVPVWLTPGALKMAGVVVFLAVVAGVSGYAGYRQGELVSKLDLKEAQLDKSNLLVSLETVKTQLAETKLNNLQELRSLELAAAQDAVNAKKALQETQAKSAATIENYRKQLVARKETPGRLSTSAVETINRITGEAL